MTSHRFFHRKKGGKSSCQTFISPEVFVLTKSVLDETTKQIVDYLSEFATYCWGFALKWCVECFYQQKKTEGSTTLWPTLMSLRQTCEGRYCVQHLIRCWIFLIAIFCSLLSNYSNNLIYFLLVKWSNFLSHLNSCPGDLPNSDSHEWNKSCLWDSCGTSNWHNTVITA